jgi:predicted dehydrogenase
MIKELIASGVIGDVVNVQSLEPVGYWHQAHSYVRGNWRREGISSPMLLAKCCHDVDWIRFIIGRRCASVQSFGTLKHFRTDQKPRGATNRCLDCPHEASCPYSAKKIYLSRVAQGRMGWPVDVLTPDVNAEPPPASP